jgi:hypothetical protein
MADPNVVGNVKRISPVKVDWKRLWMVLGAEQESLFAKIAWMQDKRN